MTENIKNEDIQVYTGTQPGSRLVIFNPNLFQMRIQSEGRRKLRIYCTQVEKTTNSAITINLGRLTSGYVGIFMNPTISTDETLLEQAVTEVMKLIEATRKVKEAKAE